MQLFEFKHLVVYYIYYNEQCCGLIGEVGEGGGKSRGRLPPYLSSRGAAPLHFVRLTPLLLNINTAWVSKNPLRMEFRAPKASKFSEDAAPAPDPPKTQ